MTKRNESKQHTLSQCPWTVGERQGLKAQLSTRARHILDRVEEIKAKASESSDTIAAAVRASRDDDGVEVAGDDDLGAFSIAMPEAPSGGLGHACEDSNSDSNSKSSSDSSSDSNSDSNRSRGHVSKGKGRSTSPVTGTEGRTSPARPPLPGTALADRGRRRASSGGGSSNHSKLTAQEIAVLKRSSEACYCAK